GRQEQCHRNSWGHQRADSEVPNHKQPKSGAEPNQDQSRSQEQVSSRRVIRVRSGTSRVSNKEITQE
ncbi:unnamed protein product, partial [Staurois parvus]